LAVDEGAAALLRGTLAVSAAMLNATGEHVPVASNHPWTSRGSFISFTASSTVSSSADGERRMPEPR
jgi:hypothetical protein